MLPLRTSVIVVCLLLASTAGARAGVCDLTTEGSTCTADLGVLYTNVLPTGTFYVDPFLDLKTSGGGRTAPDTGIEQGTNSTGIRLDDVNLVTINGVEYREFLLAIDEPGKDLDISLDELQVFLSPSATVDTSTTSLAGVSGLTSIYDLDSGTDSHIKLNYSVAATGAIGPGAMIVYVPNELFTQSSGEYVYLYSRLGATYAAGGGMEQWWIRSDDTGMMVTRTPVPEPGTLLLLGSALGVVGVRRMRRRPRQTP